jgi:molecular chaperone HtpG
MKIPNILENKFQGEHKLSSFVSTSIARIDGHIKANPIVFFPEYTDHSISHVESTLQTAVDLATCEAQNLLTGADAASLIVAVGLHDLGMYLTRDGFESLIAADSQWRGVQFFDKKPWKHLWEEFYSEATRFDDRKLKTLFGDNYRPVRALPTKGNPWEEFDFLLVGEFLRRHHPRLAHEIALHGMPGKDGASVPICPADSKENEFLADVAGLIARSHGLDLRKCMTYLESEYRNRIDPRGTHPIFLGVLLRISDYFQIQPTRAPTARTEVTGLHPVRLTPA